MSECPYKNYKSKVIEYINILRKPRQEFGNMPACPFVGAELDKGKLMIEIFDPTISTIIEMVERLENSKYDSGLFVQVTKEDLSEFDTVEYENFININLKHNNYEHLKCICFNPNDTIHVNGFNSRANAPYFLINIAKKKVLGAAHKKLLSTKYFDNMDKEYLDYLYIEEEHLRRKNEKSNDN